MIKKFPITKKFKKLAPLGIPRSGKNKDWKNFTRPVKNLNFKN